MKKLIFILLISINAQSQVYNPVGYTKHTGIKNTGAVENNTDTQLTTRNASTGLYGWITKANLIGEVLASMPPITLQNVIDNGNEATGQMFIYLDPDVYTQLNGSTVGIFDDLNNNFTGINPTSLINKKNSSFATYLNFTTATQENTFTFLNESGDVATRQWVTSQLSGVGATNITYTPSLRQINSSTGTGAVLPIANGTYYGLSQEDFTTTEKTKLAGLSATETDPVVKAINGIVKSNGTTISAAVAGTDYASASHTHSASDISSGTLSDIRLSSNVALIGGTNVFTGSNRFNSLTTIANVSNALPTPPTGTVLQFAYEGVTNARLSGFTYNSASTQGTNFQGFRARGTIASPTAATTDDVLGAFGGVGYGSTAFATAANGSMTVRAAESFTDTANGTYITLSTTNTGTNTNTERFRVSPIGALGIGGANYGTAGQILTSNGSGSAPSWSVLNGFIIQTATYTLSNSTALQKLFNATTNGAFTASASTSYWFECVFDLSGLSATSGSFGFGFLGTATYTSLKYMSVANKTGLSTLTAAPSSSVSTVATNFTITANTTSTTGYAHITGILRVNAGGTIIPAVSTSIGVATATVGINSYFKITPIGGSNTVTNSTGFN